MKLARINTVLLLAIVLINGYIIVLPLLPKITFWVQSQDKGRIQQLEAKILAPSLKAPPVSPPKENQLIIPSMLLDQPIYDGPTVKTLNKGLWRKPHGSTPDKGGNTVLVGHRLTYSNPRGTLYNLDKVSMGDKVGLWWNGEQFNYVVTEIKVVKPTEISIEARTAQPQLTIYTCTPLWLPKDRLVVIAKPESPNE